MSELIVTLEFSELAILRRDTTENNIVEYINRWLEERTQQKYIVRVSKEQKKIVYGFESEFDYNAFKMAFK